MLFAFFETLEGTIIFILMFGTVAAILVFGFALAIKHAFFSSAKRSPKIFVRAVASDYAIRDNDGIQNYSPWYIGHELESMTSNDALQLLRESYEEDYSDSEGCGIEDWIDWLADNHGYTVFYSGGDGDDGVAIITCEEEGEDEEDDND
jgi:hypothetical protein